MSVNSDMDLLIRIITGEAGEADQRQFENWIAADPANRARFDQMKSLWEKYGTVYDNYDFDQAAARVNISSRIGKYQARTRVLRARVLIGAAASLVLMLSLSYFLLINGSGPRHPLASYSTGPDEVKELVLPDSTHVWINAGSRLVIGKHFSGSNRRVWLEGEAYFQVERDPEHPFKVFTGNTVTRVLGTAFHLSEHTPGRVDLVVSEGKVAFYPQKSLKNRQVFVAGDRGIYSAGNGSLEKTRNRDLNHLAWKTGELLFSRTPLDEVCRTLTRVYGKPVTTDLNTGQYSITGSFRDETLEEVIATLTLTLDIKATITDESVILHP